MTSSRLLLILFFFQGVTAFAACKATPGADLIWRSTTLQYVFIGELHGSNETPAAFGQLVCDGLMHGRRVVVALERPTSEQVSLTSIVSSPDESAATRALLEQPDWQQGMDGRASHAMLSLLLYCDSCMHPIPPCRSSHLRLRSRTIRQGRVIKQWEPSCYQLAKKTPKVSYSYSQATPMAWKPLCSDTISLRCMSHRRSD